MASSLDFAMGILVYLVLIVIFVGILSLTGLLKDSGIDIVTNPEVGQRLDLPQTCATKHYCQATGNINLEDPDILLFTYDKPTTNFTVNGTDWCATCCKNEDTYSWFTGNIYGYSCQGQCVNLTYTGGGNFTNCSSQSVIDLSSSANTAFNVGNAFGTFVGFFTFQVDMGFGGDYAFLSWMIVLIFVYLPLLGLVLCLLWYLRGI